MANSEGCKKRLKPVAEIQRQRTATFLHKEAANERQIALCETAIARHGDPDGQTAKHIMTLKGRIEKWRPQYGFKPKGLR